MNKKIKVIDIFKIIDRGEQPPKKIKSIDDEFYFQENETSIDYLYRTDNGNGWLGIQDIGLNSYVEILEDNTEEIEELPEWITRRNGEVTQQEGKRLEMCYKINELVRTVNQIRKEREEKQ